MHSGCMTQPLTHELTSKWRSFKKCVRITAYCLRFLRNVPRRRQFARGKLGTQVAFLTPLPRWWKHDFKPPLHTVIPPLDPVGENEARNLLFKQDQAVFLHSLKLAVDHPNRFAVDSNLLKLKPRLDEQGILRQFGRFRNAKFIFHGYRAPVILGKDSNVAKGIAFDLHAESQHVDGYQALHNTMKRKFRAIGGLVQCRNVIAECLHCAKGRARTSNQAMAPLPKSRLPQTHTRLTAFESVGMDHLGVLHVKAHNGDILKRYLLLMVCMRTRAVHIEITWDKSAPSTVMALTRFQARYGTPVGRSTRTML